MNDVWAQAHKDYSQRDWIDKPSLFAETALPYFPAGVRLLELGAGQGQDSRYFATHGFKVVSTDGEQAALDLSRSKLSAELVTKVSLQRVELREALPFETASFGVIYAHLSLHYFDKATTLRLFDEIQRVLKPGGVFAFFVNSVHDPEYKMGEELEPDFFQINKMTKRYFSVASAREFTVYFDINLLDDHGETYKDNAKGVHNLLRFIGTKKITSTTPDSPSLPRLQ